MFDRKPCTLQRGAEQNENLAKMSISSTGQKLASVIQAMIRLKLGCQPLLLDTASKGPTNHNAMLLLNSGVLGDSAHNSMIWLTKFVLRMTPTLRTVSVERVASLSGRMSIVRGPLIRMFSNLRHMFSHASSSFVQFVNWLRHACIVESMQGRIDCPYTLTIHVNYAAGLCEAYIGKARLHLEEDD